MKAKEYRGLDPGIHKLAISGPNIDYPRIFFLTTKAGDPFLNLRWEDDAGEGSVWDDLLITPKASSKLEQLWSALGGDPEEEVGNVNEFAEHLVRLLSKVGFVYASIYNHIDHGLERSKIKEYLDIETGQLLMNRERSLF